MIFFFLASLDVVKLLEEDIILRLLLLIGQRAGLVFNDWLVKIGRKKED